MRWHRFLLRAFPRSWRDQYGLELLRVLKESAAESSTWATGIDLLRSGLAERSRHVWRTATTLSAEVWRRQAGRWAVAVVPLLFVVAIGVRFAVQLGGTRVAPEEAAPELAAPKPAAPAPEAAVPKPGVPITTYTGSGARLGSPVVVAVMEHGNVPPEIGSGMSSSAGELTAVAGATVSAAKAAQIASYSHRDSVIGAGAVTSPRASLSW
jgi:hypothetical protein